MADADGSVVVGARVAAQRVTGVSTVVEIASLPTGPDGAFAFTALPAGAYRLVVTAPGFVDRALGGVGSEERHDLAGTHRDRDVAQRVDPRFTLAEMLGDVLQRKSSGTTLTARSFDLHLLRRVERVRGGFPLKTRYANLKVGKDF